MGPVHAVSRREVLLVALGLAATFAAQLTAVDGWYLLSRRFWIDELSTYEIVAAPGLMDALRAIHGGIDSMPAYALLMRLPAAVVSDPSELFLRGGSLVFILLAAVGVYALLRESASSTVALAGALALWAHPLALNQAFDARFHGPFLAASVWFCLAVHRRHTVSPGRGGAIALAAAALALCSIHLFGVIVWAIVLGTSALIFRRWRSLWPALAGPAVLPALWWLALGPQRRTVTVSSWEDPFSWSRAADTTGFVLLPVFFTSVILLIWAIQATEAIRNRSTSVAPAPVSPAEILLTSLGLLVPALIAVSLVIQPTLTPRYSIAAVAALAAPIAFLTARIPRWGMVIVLSALLVSSGVILRRNANQARWQDGQTDAVIASIRELPADAQVVFEVSHVLEIVWRYAPDLRSRIALIDFESGQLPDASRMRIVSRDLARAFRRYFDGPAHVPWAQLSRSSQFYFAPDGRAYTRPPGTGRYPGFELTPVNRHVTKATRKQ
jgi:hypothetical protein